MESEINPYASPSVEPLTAIPVAVDAEADPQMPAHMPALPITFRASALSLFFMAPIGAFMALMTFQFLRESISYGQLVSFGMSIVALAMACLTAIPAFGCLMILKCKVVNWRNINREYEFP